MPETTQAGPCGELHEKLSACVSANVSIVYAHEISDDSMGYKFWVSVCGTNYAVPRPKLPGNCK